MSKLNVLVIGTGVAGLMAAIKLAKDGLFVTIVCKSKDPAENNSNLAQGGIIFSDDKKLASDIFIASSKTASEITGKIVQKESKKIIQKYLLDLAKTDFDKDENGNLLYTKEAAHSIKRIIYKGDYTGRSIETSLLSLLKTFKNVKILTNHTAIDLITLNHHGTDIQSKYDENLCLGAYCLNNQTGKVIKIIAIKTILATGGVGSLYLNTTNSTASRGDGHAMALRAGCQLLDMEFIQFHPTTLFLKHSNKSLKLNSNNFLLTEAIRGEGGILLNQHGERFMQNYDKRMELASRDVVSQSIIKEINRTKTECVYLDISHKDPNWIKKRFPEIYAYCLTQDIDITKDRIPVIPSAHYTCGGIKTNHLGQTNLKNLYAVGEVACTGLHGANRLASTSLLEGIFFGHRAATAIRNDDRLLFDSEDQHKIKIRDWIPQTLKADQEQIDQDLFIIKSTLWIYAGIIRNQTNLSRAKKILIQLKLDLDEFYKKMALTDSLIGLRNSVDVALLIVESSLRNHQSIGCFYKE